MLQPQQLQLWVHIDLGSILMESRGEERLLYKEGVSQRWENRHEDYRKHNKKEERIMTICAAIHCTFSCNFHALTHLYRSTHHHMIFICRRLSAIIAVTFIFAPEACPAISITWSQIQRKMDLSECRLIGMNAEPNVPAKAIFNRNPASLHLTRSPTECLWYRGMPDTPDMQKYPARHMNVYNLNDLMITAQK